MRSQIIEITAAGNIRLYTPGQVGAVVIQITGRLGETYLYIDDITYLTILYNLAYFLEIGKLPSVLSDETRDTSFL